MRRHAPHLPGRVEDEDRTGRDRNFAIEGIGPDRLRPRLGEGAGASQARREPLLCRLASRVHASPRLLHDAARSDRTPAAAAPRVPARCCMEPRALSRARDGPSRLRGHRHGGPWRVDADDGIPHDRAGPRARSACSPRGSDHGAADSGDWPGAAAIACVKGARRRQHVPIHRGIRLPRDYPSHCRRSGIGVWPYCDLIATGAMIRVGKIHPQGTVEMELVRLRGVGLRVVGGFMLRPAKYAVAAAAFAASVGAGWAADLPVAVKAAPAPAYLAGPWFTLFSGVTASPDSIYGEAGAVFALGHNLDTPGWLFRIKGGGGHYEYNRAPGLKQGVDFETGDLMLGYQTLVGRARITAYFGGSVEHHDNPDPLATVKGTRGGAK